MRNLIIGIAAAVMAMAVPGLASADVRATVGVHYTNLDSDSFGDSVNVWGLDGAFNNDFSNGWTLQADGSTERADSNGFNEGLSYGAVSLGMRNDQYSAYGWVGLDDLFGESGTQVGIGGQLYLNNIVLDGSVGYVNFDNTDVDGTDVNIDGAYYFNDNLNVSAHVSQLDLNNAGPNDSITVWGIGAAYRFADSPISINVGYSTADTDPDDVQAWTIGLTMDFGSDSLRDRATHGPSWNGARTLGADILNGL